MASRYRCVLHVPLSTACAPQYSVLHVPLSTQRTEAAVLPCHRMLFVATPACYSSYSGALVSRRCCTCASAPMRSICSGTLL
jgi:hypothetical protein